jgi:hypothetical protein
MSPPNASRFQNQEIVSDDRLEFPGKCSDKTGASARGFSSEYKEFLAKSFETQTYVYEQAVRPCPLSQRHLVQREKGNRG